MWTLKKSEGLVEATIPAEIGCRHDAGCADGCYVVHRHNNQEMSRAELKALAKQKNEEKKAKKAADAAAAVEVVELDAEPAEEDGEQPADGPDSSPIIERVDTQ